MLALSEQRVSGLGPVQSDGAVEVEGDDWSTGINAGLLYEPRAGSRIGLAYRSHISHEISGNADFTLPANASGMAAGGMFTDTGAQAEVTTPETLSVSFAQAVKGPLRLLADVTWTRWSRFEQLLVDFDNPVQTDAVQPEIGKTSFAIPWASCTSAVRHGNSVPAAHSIPRLLKMLSCVRLASPTTTACGLPLAPAINRRKS